uniref:Reverse transcriptase domain-containing protein n=1 Tax=Strongyloides papillosus TaxID=174720 RepID=A0A0N5CFB2_STREA
MIIENHVEYNRSLVLIYVDFLKVFDLLHRDVTCSEAGVKQDDALSSRLFCIALNRALRKANLERFGERYGNTCIPYLGLADDLVLIAPSIHKAQKMLEELTYQTSQL